ncbi:TRAP transporter small permease [Roseobacter sp. YSTF-M11]|uniref:TRAP transporter small permease protein n=1 Tax=Roseobacter insulae TaxID=2859783 RepID=A0A9X1FRY7_9RHOB|nr:TRAP transporter small permease [Roseobacter insulae]MBW4706481.1 TRAP transporter small permease [Roseobacter insulae]
MQEKSGSLVEWLVPLGFIFCGSWLIWHMPAFILDWGGHADQLAAHFARVDVTPNMPVVMGAHIDVFDLLAFVLLPVLAVVGILTVRRAPMEFEAWGPLDRTAVFVGRVTMMLIVLLMCVMLYEVFTRYVLASGTLWANELSLWLAGFIFLCSGLYAMQQRSHIRIFIIYDAMPRWLQHVCDVISTLMIVTFAFFLFYGGYGEAFQKFARWELYGSAFNPPIPATVKPAVLFIVSMVAVQSVINLIADWNTEPVVHTAADDIDEDEIARLREAVGADEAEQK